MDWTSIIRKEHEYLKIQRNDQKTRIWHDNYALATSEITDATETRSVKWNTESISNGNGRNMRHVVMLPAQTSTPARTMWLPIPRNFVTKDLEDLKATSNLSDESHNGNVCEAIDDEMFVNIVRRMAACLNSMPAESSTQVNDECQSDDPRVEYGALGNIIFESISSYFNGNYTADRYEKLTKSNTPTFTPNTDEPLVSPIQPHQSLRAYRKYFCRRCFIYNCQLHHPHSVENIDENSIKRGSSFDELEPFTEPCGSTCYLTKNTDNKTPLLENMVEESDDIAKNITDFDDKFITETIQDFEHSLDDISSLTLSSSHLSDISWNTCDQVLTSNDSGKSAQKSQSPISQTVAGDADGATDRETEWSSSDLSIFLVLFNVFPYNCCAIARTMGKPCEQVYSKVALMDPPTRKVTDKKSNRRTQSQGYGKMQKHLGQTYSPCNHKGPCNEATQCMCLNCEKYCSCGLECRKRMPKCSCKGSCTTKNCICYWDQRECDDQCECHTCKNKEIQIGRGKKLAVLPSSIHGWGVVTKEMCQKNDFISEYRGEIISIKECERREKIYDKSHCTYTFCLNGDSVIDARFFGNKVRFLNFSEKPNCSCRVMMVNGDHRIGVYAARNIVAGEELTIDYLTYDPTLQ